MTRREKTRQNTLQEIKQHARRQMAENGTAAISLSAIARAMEISAPGLYRYYASRDELVTALILDAYNDLSDAMAQAPRRLPEAQYGQRLFVVMWAYRAWALAHPIDFQLIYGNPIPGYRAPADVTTPAAQRGFAVILKILREAHAGGWLRCVPGYQHLPPGLRIALPPAEGTAFPPELIHLGVAGWYRIHGLILLELFHHTTPLFSDTGLLYRHECIQFLQSVGLPVSLEQGDDAATNR